MKQQIITGLKKKLLLVERDGSVLQQPHFEFSDKIINIYGKLTDIKEEKFAEFAQEMKDTSYPFEITTAKESFFSKLETDGILFKNPLADYDGRGLVGFSKQFEESQSKVWDINRCWLAEII